MFRHPRPRPYVSVIALQVAAALLVASSLGACGRQPAGDSGDALASAQAATATPESGSSVERGAYIATIAGCNDCHTAGYAESGGRVPRERWLLGSPIGWQGPWGTTYPANLRLKLQGMDEAAWLAYSADLHTRPPMPDFGLRAMSEGDRRALYRFIRSLGPAGESAPAYLPPGAQPPLPYVKWMLPPPPQVPAEG